MDYGMLLKIEAIHDGWHPAMPFLDILTADGETVQIETGHKPDSGMRLCVGWPVGRRDDGALLVELPAEVCSGGKHFGAWRVYVPRDSLVEVSATPEPPR